MKVVEISQRNNAPSADDPTHDVSIFDRHRFGHAVLAGALHPRRPCRARRMHDAGLARTGCVARRPACRCDQGRLRCGRFRILEEGLLTDKTQAAIDAILARVQASGRASCLAALLHQMPSSARTSLTMPQNDTTQMALRRYGIPAAYTGT